MISVLSEIYEQSSDNLKQICIDFTFTPKEEPFEDKTTLLINFRNVYKFLYAFLHFINKIYSG